MLKQIVPLMILGYSLTFGILAAFGNPMNPDLLPAKPVETAEEILVRSSFDTEPINKIDEKDLVERIKTLEMRVLLLELMEGREPLDIHQAEADPINEKPESYGGLIFLLQ